MSKALGIHIDRHSVAFAHTQLTGQRVSLLSYGLERADPNKADAAGIAARLKKLLKGIDLFDTQVVSVVNHHFLFLHEFIFPVLGPKELQEAIRWKIKDYLNFPLEDAVLDTKILEKTEEGETKRLKVLVTAIPQEVVRQHIEILKLAGVMPVTVTLIPFAFCHLLAHRRVSKDHVVATLAASGEGTLLNIFVDLKCEFTRVITSKLDRLAAEVRLSFDYFLEESRGKRVEKVLLFCAANEWDEVKALLEENLSRPVLLVHPLKDIDLLIPVSLAKDGDSIFAGQPLAIALGASLCREKCVNVMPPEVRHQTKDYLLAAGARFFAVFGAMVFLFVYVSLSARLDSAKRLRSVAQEQADGLVPLVQEVEPWEKLHKDVLDRFALFEMLLERHKVWAQILKELSVKLPNSVLLYSIAVGDTNVALSGIIKVSQQNQEKVLSNFMLALEQGVFKEVYLTNAQKQGQEGGLVFSLSSKLDI
ncbi:MAG: hypothetical protein V1863_00730 [Candidatus Omnitrophota bacterium]